MYAPALCGVVMYNYLKVKESRASQLPLASILDRTAKVLAMNSIRIDNYSHLDLTYCSSVASLLFWLFCLDRCYKIEAYFFHLLLDVTF